MLAFFLAPPGAGTGRGGRVVDYLATGFLKISSSSSSSKNIFFG